MYPYEISRMLALPQGAAETAGIADGPPVGTTACPGRNGARCDATAIGPMPGPPPPCGIANVLCRFKMADVGANRRRAREADLRVHVGAVHVDLAAVLVDDRADLADAVLEHAVRARIGHHQARQPIAMGGGLRAQIVDVHVAPVVAGDDDDLHAGERGARRIGAVRRLRNQHDVARGLPALRVIRAG